MKTQAMKKTKTLRDARRTKGWTQTQLAEAVGMSQVAISIIESGKKHPRKSTKQALETALNVNLRFKAKYKPVGRPKQM